MQKPRYFGNFNHGNLGIKRFYALVKDLNGPQILDLRPKVEVRYLSPLVDLGQRFCHSEVTGLLTV